MTTPALEHILLACGGETGTRIFDVPKGTKEVTLPYGPEPTELGIAGKTFARVTTDGYIGLPVFRPAGSWQATEKAK